MNCRSEASRIADQVRWFSNRRICIGRFQTNRECHRMLAFLHWVETALPKASVRSGADLYRLYRAKEMAARN